MAQKILIIECEEFKSKEIVSCIRERINICVEVFQDAGQIENYILSSVHSKSHFTIIASFEILYKLKKLKKIAPLSKSMIIDFNESLNHAITSNKHGIDKYFAWKEGREVFARSLKTLLGHKTKASSYLEEEDIFHGMIGRSWSMKEIFKRIQKIAGSNSTVLITGASGTGKELIAQAIHALSSRNEFQFVGLNCGAIPANLLESELFGHIKGAFTGADRDKLGKFEFADKGTVFLDEIGDMPFELQVKLLRAIQTRRIEILGSNESKLVDTRIIAATHHKLEELVEKKLFRRDLFYRLNVIPIELPELCQRKEDIPLLVEYFSTKMATKNHTSSIDFSDEALNALKSYSWPGNIRELENLIERLSVLKQGEVIYLRDLSKSIQNEVSSCSHAYELELPSEGIDLKQTLGEIENSLIKQALEKTQGNKKKASELLKIKRTTLVEKIKKHQGLESLSPII